MARRADVVKRLLEIVVGLWLARWLAGELAAYAGRHWQPHGPAPRNSPRKPGWIPGTPKSVLRRHSEP